MAHTFALALNFAVSSVNAAIVPWTYEAVAERKLKELNRIITILAGGFAALLLVSVLVMPEIMKLLIKNIKRWDASVLKIQRWEFILFRIQMGTG